MPAQTGTDDMRSLAKGVIDASPFMRIGNTLAKGGALLDEGYRRGKRKARELTQRAMGRVRTAGRHLTGRR